MKRVSTNGFRRTVMRLATERNPCAGTCYKLETIRMLGLAVSCNVGFCCFLQRWMWLCPEKLSLAVSWKIGFGCFRDNGSGCFLSNWIWRFMGWTFQLIRCQVGCQDSAAHGLWHQPEALGFPAQISGLVRSSWRVSGGFKEVSFFFLVSLL